MVRILEIEDYAKQNNIPIMVKDGIDFLTDYITKNNYKHILEIGSAIGYSAIKMASISPDIRITTIERDVDRYNIAVKNIADLNYQDQITIICKDALLVDIEGQFDCIFIDAAKAQNIKFFEKYKVNLKQNGTIITDNIDFHGLTNTTIIESRNLRQMIRKLKNYITFLNENKEFKTEFLKIGDGIAISKRVISA